jgi:ABC-type transporter Mla MlaB component
VTLRIVCDQESGISVIRLEGWLEGDVVAELERVVSEYAGPLRLDLTQLRAADSAGLTVLRALRGQGAGALGLAVYPLAPGNRDMRGGGT